MTSSSSRFVRRRYPKQWYSIKSDDQYNVEMLDDFHSGTLSVINLDGQIVETKEISDEKISVSVDITYWPSGYYHVVLYPEENMDRVFWSK